MNIVNKRLWELDTRQLRDASTETELFHTLERTAGRAKKGLPGKALPLFRMSGNEFSMVL